MGLQVEGGRMGLQVEGGGRGLEAGGWGVGGVELYYYQFHLTVHH